MQRWVVHVCVAVMLTVAAPTAARAAECADLWDWVNTACRRLADRGSGQVHGLP